LLALDVVPRGDGHEGLRHDALAKTKEESLRLQAFAQRNGGGEHCNPAPHDYEDAEQIGQWV